MNAEERFRRFAASFYSVAMELPMGTVYRPPRPISLSDALGRDAGRRLARDQVQPLIEFGQGRDGIGTVELGVLPLGHASGFLCLRDAGSDAGHVVAAAVSRIPRVLLSSWLAALLAHNGADYGVEILKRLPPWIRCRRPDLVHRDSVKRALWRWLEWANREGVCRWPELRRHVVHRWGRDEWAPVPSHEDRRSLLRIYFQVSYIEDIPSAVAARASDDMLSRWTP